MGRRTDAYWNFAEYTDDWTKVVLHLDHVVLYGQLMTRLHGQVTTSDRTEHKMADELKGKRVAILAADGVERVELEQPRQALLDAGATTELLSLHEGEIKALKNDLDEAGTFSVDALVKSVSVDDYDALLLPGGTVNPDQLRLDADAVGFVRDFVATGKLVASICHGPWTLIEAGVAKGRTLTSYPSIRTDLRNAGANVVDEEVARDGNLITSRWPDDLPAFCSAIIEQLSEAKGGDND